MNDEQNLFIKQTDLLLKVLNQQRHDWLNHFQVLLGYLKLGRPEQGAEYLQRVTELTFQETLISRINCSRLSVFFLTFNAIHNDLLLEVEVCNHVDLSLVKPEQDELFELVTGMVFTVKQHIIKDKFETKSLLISLTATEQSVQLRFDLAGRLDESGTREVEKLLERSKMLAATVSEWTNADEEWVVEFNFPFAEQTR